MLPDLNNKDLKDWGWRRVWRVREGVFSSTIMTPRSRTSERQGDTVLRVEEHLEDTARALLDSRGSDRIPS